MIREATPEDSPGASAVVRAAYPELVTTEAGFRHRQAALPPEARARAWVAVEDDQVVGWGRAFYRYEESGGSGQLNLSVAPDWRRRGIGSALLMHILDHLDEAPRAFAFATGQGQAFAERHGFELTQTMRVSAVDPRSVDTRELDSAGVDLRPVAEVGPEQAFAVDAIAWLDVPTDEPPDRLEYEHWLRGHWENPDVDLAASYAACVDGRAVAVSYAAVDYAGARATTTFTGVLPDHRGRGLARLVKLAVVRHVAAHGVGMLVTDNDERNAPMLAVNERLGFRPHGAHYIYVRHRGNG